MRTRVRLHNISIRGQHVPIFSSAIRIDLSRPFTSLSASAMPNLTLQLQSRSFGNTSVGLDLRLPNPSVCTYLFCLSTVSLIPFILCKNDSAFASSFLPVIADLRLRNLSKTCLTGGSMHTPTRQRQMCGTINREYWQGTRLNIESSLLKQSKRTCQRIISLIIPATNF